MQPHRHRTQRRKHLHIRPRPRRRLDPWAVRAAYEELQAATGFPLRPTDTLFQDLRLDEDDLDLDMLPDIANRCGRSLVAPEKNPATRVETVHDLIAFLNAQPRTA